MPRPKKLVRLADIAKLMGENEVNRILSAFARKERKAMKPLSRAEIEEARKYLSGELTGQRGVASFKRAAHKFVTESGGARTAFHKFLTAVEKDLSSVKGRIRKTGRKS